MMKDDASNSEMKTMKFIINITAMMMASMMIAKMIMLTLMIAMVISMMMMMTGQSALDLQKVCCGSWHSWLVSSIIFFAVFPSQCIYKIVSCCIQLKAALHSADAVFPDTVFSVVCLSVYGRSDCGSTALH